MHYNFLLIVIRLKKCVIKLLILILLQYNLFLSAVKLRKYVIKLFIIVLLYICLLALKSVLVIVITLLQKKFMKNSMLYSLMMINSLKKKILMFNCVVMIWALLLQILIILTLAWHNRFRQSKAFNKDISKELMPAASIQQDGKIGAYQKIKKRNRTIFD